MTTQKEIDQAANNYNKTKDVKYKDLWYKLVKEFANDGLNTCLLYTSPSPRDRQKSRMPSSA